MAPSSIRRTELPGVGIRNEMPTRAGRTVGVLAHHGGGRDLLLYADDDPDRCTETIRLDEDEAIALASILGVEHAEVQPVHHTIGDATVDWVEVRDEWWVNGAAIPPIGEMGVAVVAVIRSGVLHEPSAVDRARLADVLVLVGPTARMDGAVAHLESGPD